MPSYILLLFFMIILIIYLFKTNQKINYYCKYSYYIGYISTMCIILMPYLTLRWRNVLNLAFVSPFCTPVSKHLGLKWHIRGEEHLKIDQSYIIVSNHQSIIDVLGFLEICPLLKRCSPIAKRKVFYVWPFGLGAYLVGLTFIDKKCPKETKINMDNIMKKLKKERTKLWIFPEGTRIDDNKIHEFKKGAFHTAISAQVPILPFVFSSYKTFLDHKNKKFTSGNIIMKALPLISTEGMTSNDVDSILEKTRNLMNEVFIELNKEVETM